ncbi:MAG: SUMF1/EgtB/PvdO family nonheme iron enzyme, partial [Desulfococcaceae bacterium]
IVTTREYAFKNNSKALFDEKKVFICPFSKDQIKCFIDNWYNFVATHRRLPIIEARSRAELLKHAILNSTRLRELAKRPLILTLMAIIHAWRGGSLSEKREELYADAVDLLLDWWESGKVRKDSARKIIGIEPGIAEILKTERSQVRAKLSELAYEAHLRQEKLQGTADIPEKDLVYGLLELSSEKQAIDPRKLIQFLEQRAGLLIQKTGKIYTFPHRTFQEYLAACHLTELDYPYQVADLTRDDPDRWREVVLLAGAKAAGGSSSGVWHLADALCFENPEKETISMPDFWGGLLAGQALVETANLDKVNPRHQSKLERIRQWQVKIVVGDELPAIERAMAGRNLAVMDDPRKSVTTLEHMAFCLVPGGPFHMGSDKNVREKPPGLNKHLNYDYWISRYPITNAQFEEFVKAGGYTERRFWRVAEKAGFWKESGFKGRYDNDYRTRPNEYRSPFHLPNHPVVGIALYEALAFTEWLTEIWEKNEMISKKWRIRLPSEAEWEKAARGGLEIPEPMVIGAACENHWDQKAVCISNTEPEREYPWGNRIDKEKANYDDTGIGSTSAVGCFSAGESRYGCLDMAGNVWDWTRSLWGKSFSRPEFKYPYVPSPEREDEFADNEIKRVLRGGAFYNTSDDLRCASRNNDDPDSRFDRFGFRCVCAPN